MAGLHRLHLEVSPDRPVLVAHLDGFIDAGLGAAEALEHLRVRHRGELVASWDPDELLDHRARRPVLELVDGVSTELSIPTIELFTGRDDNHSDLLLLTGPEPDLRWRAFARDLVAMAARLDARAVVWLGAYPAPAPHTRPVRVVATSPDPALAAEIGFLPGALQVPASVFGAIEQECTAVAMAAVGLWAQVPHYAASMPYPAASAALLATLSRIMGLRIDISDLEAMIPSNLARLDELVAASDEAARLVSQLEEYVDALEPGQAAGGEDLASEIERFLSQWGGDEPPEES